jgi:hypothetical protein
MHTLQHVDLVVRFRITSAREADRQRRAFGATGHGRLDEFGLS